MTTAGHMQARFSKIDAFVASAARWQPAMRILDRMSRSTTGKIDNKALRSGLGEPAR